MVGATLAREAPPRGECNEWGVPMKAGFRVFDSDTHVNPAAECLERHVEADFRPRLAELAPFRIPTRGNNAQNGGTPGTSQYRVHFKAFRRVLGQGS